MSPRSSAPNPFDSAWSHSKLSGKSASSLNIFGPRTDVDHLAFCQPRSHIGTASEASQPQLVGMSKIFFVSDNFKVLNGVVISVCVLMVDLIALWNRPNVRHHNKSVYCHMMRNMSSVKKDDTPVTPTIVLSNQPSSGEAHSLLVPTHQSLGRDRIQAIKPRYRLPLFFHTPLLSEQVLRLLRIVPQGRCVNAI